MYDHRIDTWNTPPNPRLHTLNIPYFFEFMSMSDLPPADVKRASLGWCFQRSTPTPSHVPPRTSQSSLHLCLWLCCFCSMRRHDQARVHSPAPPPPPCTHPHAHPGWCASLIPSPWHPWHLVVVVLQQQPRQQPRRQPLLTRAAHQHHAGTAQCNQTGWQPRQSSLTTVEYTSKSCSLISPAITTGPVDTSK